MGTTIKTAFVAIFFVVLIAGAFYEFISPVRALVPISMTRTFTVLNYDSSYGSASAVYLTAWNAATGTPWGLTNWQIGGQINATIYGIYRSFLYFDTSSMPDDANITSAILKLYVNNNYNSTDYNVTIQTGSSSIPHTPSVPADFYRGYYSGDGGSRNTSDACSNSTFWNITLSASGMGWINMAGNTRFAIRSSNDIAGIAPSGNEYLFFNSYEAGDTSSPKLIVTYTGMGYNYLVHGAFEEDGSDNLDGMNCTMYRKTEAPYPFFLNGTQNVTTETTPDALKMNLGASFSNYSRTYYIMDDFEDIYCFYPSTTDSPNIYYFNYVDFAGLTNAYLESVINVNGTDRVVERWKLAPSGNYPFVFSFGHVYKMRVVSDQGTIEVNGSPFTASNQYQFYITTADDDLPWIPKGLENLTATAFRINATRIQVTYYDPYNLTSWVWVGIYEASNATVKYYVNYTSQGFVLNWDGALTDMTYYAYVAAQRTYDAPTWQFAIPAIANNLNPWSGLDTLGYLPFPPRYAVGAFLVVVVFCVFSWKSAILGIIAPWLTSVLMAWLGWLPIVLEWQIISGVVCFIIAFSIGKSREVTVQ